MTHPDYIREKARKLRIERQLTIDEIAERLALSRSTIFHWLRDVPLTRPRRANPGQRLGHRSMRLKYKRLRDEAYEQGWEEFDDLCKEPSFRDFVCMYIGEGYKRCRNQVSLANSDPDVIVLAEYWIRRFARNPVTFGLQYHADQDVEALRRFWGRLLRVDPAAIRLQRKSNSGQLAGRTWRSRFGVLTVNASDTLLRSRLQAWIDRICEQWLDLPPLGA